jgi:hypothetical protein
MVISSVGSQAGDRRSATLILSANACAGLSLVDSITLASVLLDCTSCRYNASVTGSFIGVPLHVNGVEKTLSKSLKHGGLGSKSKSRKNCAVVSVVPSLRTAAQRAKVVRLLQRQVEQAAVISLSSVPRTQQIEVTEQNHMMRAHVETANNATILGQQAAFEDTAQHEMSVPACTPAPRTAPDTKQQQQE